MSVRYDDVAREHVKRLRSADTAVEADKIMQAALNRLGYGNYIYGWGVGNLKKRISREVSFRTTLSISFMERYLKTSQPFVDQDFYAWQCDRQTEVILWGDPAIHAIMNPMERACDGWLAESAGLCVGHTLPLAGFAGAGVGGIGICAHSSITQEKINDHWRNVGWGVNMLVRAYHEELHGRLLRAEVGLTPQEKTVLEHQLSGYGPKEIAQIIGRSEKAVYGYLRAATEKLGARTDGQALIRAYSIRAISDRSDAQNRGMSR
ncbi:helix-turn-helix transcriptional regulator [Niveispirillum sp.]|uniref:helix-turn-helix transcriptional regulator n=1 Tax=Niveispirillum sp. TaxID=1917217 RepID=UPI001B498360|nr:helix-turn-helix transcriptional regulator [Niveispirillum sp.]MBP7334920.1 helix-turn-helix transcriptional regulator [Niveispirillum sp.]